MSLEQGTEAQARSKGMVHDALLMCHVPGSRVSPLMHQHSKAWVQGVQWLQRRRARCL